MGVIDRAKSILEANFNALLDKAEDPVKAAEQELINAKKEYANVKSETAGVAAERMGVQRSYEKNEAEIKRYGELAEKAFNAGDEEAAQKFFSEQSKYESNRPSLKAAYDLAVKNEEIMKQLHDKLKADIQIIEMRRTSITSKASVAKAQEAVNRIGANSGQYGRAMDAFDRLEQKVDKKLDKASAMAELNTGSDDGIKDLEAKYGSGVSPSVEDKMAELRARKVQSENV